jgi:hypothetical protein
MLPEESIESCARFSSRASRSRRRSARTAADGIPCVAMHAAGAGD